MKNTLLILWIIICCKISFAQISVERQVIGSTGNLTNTGAIIASSTVGEAVIPTFSQSSLIVTQGFQQPDTMIVTEINYIDVSAINISAYPNPTMSKVILDFTGNQTLELAIEIFNSAGQLMSNPTKISVQNNLKQELNFADFASGYYFIVVKSVDGKRHKGFKVQKTNQ